MIKNKGSALVMSVVITSVLIILSLSVLSLSASSYKNNIAYDRINQVRLLAESGIEQAIGQLANGTNTTVANIVSSDNYITCKVNISPSTSYPENLFVKYYTIVSTASGGSGRYSKTIEVDFKKVISSNTTGGGTPTQVSDLVNNYLIKNAVTLYVKSDGESVFTWPPSSGNSANIDVRIYGDMYFGGKNINFTPTVFYLNGDVSFQGDTSIIQQTKNNAGVLNGTIAETSSMPPDIHPVIDPSVIDKVVLYTSGTSNLIGYTTNKDSYLYNINQTIYNSIYKSYANNSNVYKVVMVDGDLTIYKNTYYDYIIYCTGKVYIEGDGTNNAENVVTMVNSVICANKGLQFKNKVNLTIDNRVGIPASAGNIITDYLSQGLTQPDAGSIVRWKE
jgi:hypothetical protein